MPRGEVTAYVRVPAHLEETATQALALAGFWAERDHGDPDRPAGTRDLYVSRHYGMTNPDAEVIERHHAGVARALDVAGVPSADLGGGVLWCGEIPGEQLLTVLDVRASAPTGHTIRATTPTEADDQLAVLAVTLGRPREDLSVQSPDGWAEMPRLHQSLSRRPTGRLAVTPRELHPGLTG
jgi:hypothetical protein